MNKLVFFLVLHETISFDQTHKQYFDSAAIQQRGINYREDTGNSLSDVLIYICSSSQGGQET